MNDRPRPESTLDRLADPRPALILGTLAWVIATVVVFVTKEGSSGNLSTCFAGIGVGVLGYGLFLWQRRSARRGRPGAQQGLL